MKKQREGYMSTGSERMRYWSYLIGQNFSYTMMSVFLTTYMMMQGVDLGIIDVYKRQGQYPGCHPLFHCARRSGKDDLCAEGIWQRKYEPDLYAQTG